MTQDELQKMKDEDLKKELATKREALREFRFGIAGSQVRNVREGRGHRKDIAQILTEMTKRKNQEETTAANNL